MSNVTGSGIAYVMLGVTDLDRSLMFYEHTLGRPVKFKSAEFAFVDAGPITIGLSPSLGRNRPHLGGAMELVFAVESVNASWRELSTNGVTFVNSPRQATGNDWVATFTDPDGHYLTLFGPKGE
jgi:catechol 2,3-dioxygenase-like lactoylglutathione lyase family enzyme